MKHSINHWLWIFCLCLLAACGVQPATSQVPSMTISPPPILTPTTLPTSTALSVQTPFPPTLTPILTVTPSPTITPTLPPGAPSAFLTAPGLFIGSWSPDGRYFSFLSQTREDLDNMFVGEGRMEKPPGTQNFYDLQTGQTCSYPEQNVLQLNFRTGWIGWKGDHAYQVLTYTGELVTLEAPCIDQPHALAGVFTEPVLSTLTFSRDDKLALLYGKKTCWLYDIAKETAVSVEQCSSVAAFSPNDDWLAMTTGVPTTGVDPDQTTYVYTAPKRSFAESHPMESL